ncbi:zinc ribbon domain-containing protein [Rhodococcus opacus]|uniref:zinc ribbon domain-containing protein n=1 Tax=Rhodococcus opacus TaxID=37919 RepID=UPI0034D24BF2
MPIQTTGTTLAYPPRVTPFTEPFWQGLNDGVLRTTRCRACSHMTFPPNPSALSVGSPNWTGWI